MRTKYQNIELPFNSGRPSLSGVLERKRKHYFFSQNVIVNEKKNTARFIWHHTCMPAIERVNAKIRADRGLRVIFPAGNREEACGIVSDSGGDIFPSPRAYVEWAYAFFAPKSFTFHKMFAHRESSKVYDVGWRITIRNESRLAFKHKNDEISDVAGCLRDWQLTLSRFIGWFQNSQAPSSFSFFLQIWLLQRTWLFQIVIKLPWKSREKLWWRDS